LLSSRFVGTIKRKALLVADGHHMTDTLDTFGDVTLDAEGQPLSHAQVLRNVVAQAILAD
jgi:hypothetical protein